MPMTEPTKVRLARDRKAGFEALDKHKTVPD
jgi:hypothetical protein